MLARTWKVLRLWGAALVGGLALGATARAQSDTCAVAGPTTAGCASCASCVHYEAQTHCCPKPLKYFYEGPPKLCFKKACPKPICDPCELKHYGYYQTCWHPYPFPPDWSHCAAPPVGALLPPCCPHRTQVQVEDRKMPDAEPLPRPSPAPAPTPFDGARSTQPPTWLPPPSVGRPEPTNASPARYQEQPVTTPQGPPLTQTRAPEPAPYPTPATPAAPRPLPPLPEPQWTPPPPPVPARQAPPLDQAAPIRRTSAETSAEGGPGHGVQQAVVKDPVEPVESPKDLGLKKLAGPGAPVDKPAPAREEGPAADHERPRAGLPGGVVPGVRMVNSQQILLDFNAAELAPAQRAALELWWTRDGKNWSRDAAARFQDNAIMTQVAEEGTFGYSVLQHKSDGSGPAASEQPQMWVEADWKKPTVKLLDARFHRTAQNRQVIVTWLANDRNLADQPVALSYANRPEGPWTTFAPSVANTGRYTWTVPGHVTGPVFVRVEAFDLMGNVGVDQTAQPIATAADSGMTGRR